MRGLMALFAVALFVALALGGTAPFGRLLLSAGLPGLAAPLFADPNWRGVAHYRAQDMQAAARAFAAARAHYNRGTAEARLGHYAAALEAYDLVIHGGDADQRPAEH